MARSRRHPIPPANCRVPCPQPWRGTGPVGARRCPCRNLRILISWLVHSALASTHSTHPHPLHHCNHCNHCNPPTPSARLFLQPSESSARDLAALVRWDGLALCAHLKAFSLQIRKSAFLLLTHTSNGPHRRRQPATTLPIRQTDPRHLEPATLRPAAATTAYASPQSSRLVRHPDRRN